MSSTLRFLLPPKGFIARRFIEIAVLTLGKGIEIRGDELIITDCMSFSQSLKNLISNLNKDMDIFLTGNDRTYVMSKIAKLLGLGVSGRSKPVDLLEALSKVIESNVKSGCLTKDLCEEITVLNIFKANFYEYGRTYLSKPRDKFLKIDKLPIFIQLLGIAGILISTVGTIREQGIRYYIFTPEGIPLKLPPTKSKEIIDHFNTAYRILKNYYDMPRSVLTVRLAMELINAGCEEDVVIAELVGVQENRRATVISVEPISTEGLIQLVRTSITNRDDMKTLATMLGELIDIGLRSLRGRANGDKTGSLILRLSSDLLIYARTRSLDALYSAISILGRTKEYVRMNSQDFTQLITALRDMLKDKGIEPHSWLSKLTTLMGMLVRAHEVLPSG